MLQQHRWNLLRLTQAAAVVLAAVSVVTACTSSVKLGPDAVAGLTPDATVEMRQVQVAYIGSAGGGDGTLNYQGQVYPFKIGGLGIGGIGASTLDAEGEVYKLNSLAAFAGNVRPSPLRLRRRKYEWWRPVAAERVRCDHASQGEAHRTDAEPGRGCCRNQNVFSGELSAQTATPG